MAARALLGAADGSPQGPWAAPGKADDAVPIHPALALLRHDLMPQGEVSNRMLERFVVATTATRSNP